MSQPICWWLSSHSWLDTPHNPNLLESFHAISATVEQIYAWFTQMQLFLLLLDTPNGLRPCPKRCTSARLISMDRLDKIKVCGLPVLTSLPQFHAQDVGHVECYLSVVNPGCHSPNDHLGMIFHHLFIVIIRDCLLLGLPHYSYTHKITRSLGMLWTLDMPHFREQIATIGNPTI